MTGTGVIKGNVNSNGKLVGYGFYFYPLPHPQVLLDGAPLKNTSRKMVARRRDGSEERKSRTQWNHKQEHGGD